MFKQLPTDTKIAIVLFCLMLCGITFVGCTAMLNKDTRRPDTSLPEMTIPKGFRITNEIPRIE
jgi:hypothetical protein